ncbi:MAG: hypothetical protein IID36_00720 [Planctomycetes bacterium]|nr:hypothetical protein [Planctomycetota bacterium]
MTPTAEHEPTREALKTRGLWGWLSVVVNFGYTVFGYYGFAPPPGGMPTDWWHGRTYILDFESMGGYVDNPLMGAFLFALPAIGVCLATFLSSRSAIARMLSLSLALTSTLFAVAGYAAASPWELFSWRFTAVLALTGLSLAAAVVAPLLVASWLRLSSRARCIVYLPIFFCTMAAVRGATGTSEHLMFMISPWPLFTTLCLDNCVLVVAGNVQGRRVRETGQVDDTGRRGAVGRCKLEVLDEDDRLSRRALGRAQRNQYRAPMHQAPVPAVATPTFPHAHWDPPFRLAGKPYFSTR